MQSISDLSRKFFLDVCAAGSVHIRARGEPMFQKMRLIPVFSTDTKEQAEAIRVFHCRLARDDSGTYTLNEPPKDVDDLDRVAAMFRDTYELVIKRPARKASRKRRRAS